jgi:hypothetical protein
MSLPVYKTHQSRWKLDEADWPSICQAVSGRLPTPHHIASIEELELQANKLIHTVTTKLQVVPRTKPSPYSKRWWTAKLS